MSGHRKSRVAASLIALLLAAGCFRTTAPKGWLPTAAASQQDAWGAWASVLPASPTGVAAKPVEGELLAVQGDSLHLLTRAGFQSLALRDVTRATLTTYAADRQAVISWGALGMLSALSHGFFAILSLPAWIATTSFSAAATSKAPRLITLDTLQLAQFARFPQGLPPGVRRESLRPKTTLESGAPAPR